MANWCNLRLSVFGPPDEISAFRKAAGRLKGRINAEKSTVFSPEMERGESGDLTAYEPKRFGRRFQRVDSTLQGRNTDHADHFQHVSERYPALAFVLTFGDPNADTHGSHLFLRGTQRIGRVGSAAPRADAEALQTVWPCELRGHTDYDAEDSDWAEWMAYFEIMDRAAAPGTTRSCAGCGSVTRGASNPFRLSLWKGARCESRLVGPRLVAPIDEGGALRPARHGPVNLPAFVVVLADLGVEAAISAVLEDVPREREDHRRVLGVLDDVFVRPRSG